MNLSVARILALLVVVLTCWMQAHAGVVKGSFRGMAYDSRIDALGPSPRNFDGEVVTGSFYFNTAGLYPPEVHEPNDYFGTVQTGGLRLVFNTMGRTVLFGGDESGDAVYATSGPEGQAVHFNPGYSFPYYFAGLLLAGPLLDGVDPATFRPDPVDLENSFAYFFAGREFGAMVDLTEVRFETRELPEPSSGLLALWGLVLLLGRRALVRKLPMR